MSNYNDLIQTLSELNMESSEPVSLIKETVVLDDEHDGTSVISKDLKTVLDRNKINYVVNTKELDHPKALDNAVVNGIYDEHLDPQNSKRVKVIYDDSLNVDHGADVYVVQNEAVAASMESQGYVVARYPNQLIDILSK